jgi:NRAMP (natural resistance-associated macrophage protein)-like metal ion transporter
MAQEPPIVEPQAPTAPALSSASSRQRVFTRHRGQPQPLRTLNRFFRILGPGLITGAADDDPSGIGTYSQSGAAYGPSQLWLALYMLPLMIAVQEMCGRIGLVTGQGIAGIVRKHYSRRILFATVGLLVVANTINVGADLGAMVAATQLLIPLPFVPLLLAFTLGMLALEIFVPYRYYARILKVLTFSLFAYIITGIIIQPDWGSLLLKTVVPTIRFTPAFLALVVGLLGTTISPYLFFWQASEEVEEAELHHRNQHNGDAAREKQALGLQVRRLRLDTFLGMLASEVTTWFIIMATGSTLYTHGITSIQTADQAAQALTPLVHSFPHAGQFAELIFALGIVGTGLLAIPVLAGSAAYGVAEAFGWHEGLARTVTQARGFYGVIALATIVGLLLNLLGINPIAALVYTAVINGIVAVPLLALILLVANNHAIMGEHTNGPLGNIVGWLATGLMGIAAIVTVVALFIGQ